MPPPEERLRLREAAGFSRAHFAATVGVGRQTIANWETGVSDPTPPARYPYLRILKGLAEIYPAPPAPPAPPASPRQLGGDRSPLHRHAHDASAATRPGARGARRPGDAAGSGRPRD
ncbi:helix-turn-helix transcriptional regulator [Streptomyces griseus]